MGGRIVDLNSPHLAAQALMPWLLNGTLTSAERRELEAHLHACASCRAELARQRDLMALYAASPVPVAQGAADAAFARIQARLPAAAADGPRRGARAAPWWRLAAAVQAGVIVALGWTVWLLQPAATTPDASAAAYRGLAAATSAPAAGDAIVVFRPNTSEAELRRALQAAGARIVDGPTASGAYVLRFEGRRGEASVAQLRADTSVERVEALSAGPR